MEESERPHSEEKEIVSSFAISQLPPLIIDETFVSGYSLSEASSEDAENIWAPFPSSDCG